MFGTPIRLPESIYFRCDPKGTDHAVYRTGTGLRRPLSWISVDSASLACFTGLLTVEGN
jgi:hypothetical protein